MNLLLQRIHAVCVAQVKKPLYW